MTTALANRPALPTVLLVDGAVTAAVGALALATPDWYGAPGWVVRTVGVLLLVTGAELTWLSRQSGRVLRVGTTVAMELAFAWVAATAVVLAVRDVPTRGAEVLVLVALVTAGFGTAYARLR